MAKSLNTKEGAEEFLKSLAVIGKYMSDNITPIIEEPEQENDLMNSNLRKDEMVYIEAATIINNMVEYYLLDNDHPMGFSFLERFSGAKRVVPEIETILDIAKNVPTPKNTKILDALDVVKLGMEEIKNHQIEIGNLYKISDKIETLRTTIYEICDLMDELANIFNLEAEVSDKNSQKQFLTEHSNKLFGMSANYRGTKDDELKDLTVLNHNITFIYSMAEIADSYFTIDSKHITRPIKSSLEGPIFRFDPTATESHKSILNFATSYEDSCANKLLDNIAGHEKLFEAIEEAGKIIDRAGIKYNNDLLKEEARAALSLVGNKDVIKTLQDFGEEDGNTSIKNDLPEEVIGMLPVKLTSIYNIATMLNPDNKASNIISKALEDAGVDLEEILNKPYFIEKIEEVNDIINSQEKGFSAGR